MEQMEQKIHSGWNSIFLLNSYPDRSDRKACAFHEVRKNDRGFPISIKSISVNVGYALKPNQDNIYSTNGVLDGDHMTLIESSNTNVPLWAEPFDKFGEVGSIIGYDNGHGEGGAKVDAIRKFNSSGYTKAITERFDLYSGWVDQWSESTREQLVHWQFPPTFASDNPRTSVPVYKNYKIWARLSVNRQYDSEITDVEVGSPPTQPVLPFDDLNLAEDPDGVRRAEEELGGKFVSQNPDAPIGGYRFIYFPNKDSYTRKIDGGHYKAENNTTINMVCVNKNFGDGNEVYSNYIPPITSAGLTVYMDLTPFTLESDEDTMRYCFADLREAKIEYDYARFMLFFSPVLVNNQQGDSKFPPYPPKSILLTAGSQPPRLSFLPEDNNTGYRLLGIYTGPSTNSVKVFDENLNPVILSGGYGYWTDTGLWSGRIYNGVRYDYVGMINDSTSQTLYALYEEITYPIRLFYNYNKKTGSQVIDKRYTQAFMLPDAFAGRPGQATVPVLYWINKNGDKVTSLGVGEVSSENSELYPRYAPMAYLGNNSARWKPIREIGYDGCIGKVKTADGNIKEIKEYKIYRDGKWI